MKSILLLFLVSCAAYSDPTQEKLTYYKCDNNKILTTKHSDDYESMMIRYNKDHNVLLHHFVSIIGSGYRNEKFLWITKGELAVLIEKQPNGSEIVMYNNCRLQK